MEKAKLHGFYAGVWTVLTAFSVLAFLGLTLFASKTVNLGSLPAVSPGTLETGVIPAIDLIIYFAVFFSLFYLFAKIKIKPNFSSSFIYNARRNKMIGVFDLYKIALTLSLMVVVQFSLTGFAVSDTSLMFFYGNVFSLIAHLIGIVFFSGPIFLYMAVKSL